MRVLFLINALIADADIIGWILLAMTLTNVMEKDQKFAEKIGLVLTLMETISALNQLLARMRDIIEN